MRLLYFESVRLCIVCMIALFNKDPHKLKEDITLQLLN